VDGLTWKWLSTITRHEPETNRMNHAAGLNAAGELVVLCNGWDKVAPQRNAESRPIQTVACFSRDGGRTWEQGGPVLPKVEGLSWHVISPIVENNHCETAILHLGDGKWLTASRRFGMLDLDLFASDDDAFTWHPVATLDIKPVSSAHLLKLSDGRVLLTYGNRGERERRGIEARTSADGGLTWGQPQQLVALEKTDCGYPDAIELEDGRILLAYYCSSVSAHQRYHMGVIQFLAGDLR
jgi:hypothetical protein